MTAGEWFVAGLACLFVVIGICSSTWRGALQRTAAIGVLSFVLFVAFVGVFGDVRLFGYASIIPRGTGTALFWFLCASVGYGLRWLFHKAILGRD